MIAKKINMLTALIMVVALCVCAVSVFFLWVTDAVQVDGDVLIHLVLARNIADGRPFEYGIGQPTNAGTAPLWEWMLAYSGKMLGVIQNNELFFIWSRILTVILLGAAFGMIWRFTRHRQVDWRDRLIILGFILACPVTIYWCLICPMETAMAIILVLAVLWGVDRVFAHKKLTVGALLYFAILSLLLYLIRPELLIVPVAAGLLCIWNYPKRVKNTFLFAIFGCLLFGLAFELFRSLGGSLLPGAAGSRRQFLKHYNTILLPVLHLRVNLDALMFCVFYSPFIGALIWKLLKKRKADYAAIVNLLCLLIITGFLTMVFCTSWRGRYVLPLYIPIIMLGLPLLKITKSTHRTFLFVVYMIAINSCLLVPLYKQIPGRKLRSMPTRVEYYIPAEDEKTIMVQEVQSAYYHPHLQYISTDGLIDGRIMDALDRGTSYYDFIYEMKPDLLGFGYTLLDDPEGLQDILMGYMSRGESGSYSNLIMEYAGYLKGSGHVLKMSYME